MPSPTVADLTELLARHDLEGLTALGAPRDEYEPEAKTVHTRLAEVDSPAAGQRILQEEFTMWFGDAAAPDTAALAEAGTELYELVRV